MDSTSKSLTIPPSINSSHSTKSEKKTLTHTHTYQIQFIAYSYLKFSFCDINSIHYFNKNKNTEKWKNKKKEKTEQFCFWIWHCSVSREYKIQWRFLVEEAEVDLPFVDSSLTGSLSLLCFRFFSLQLSLFSSAQILLPKMTTL